LCGIGVMSRIDFTSMPTVCSARIADSRPDPGPFTLTSTDRSQDVEILATYVERDILQSGWLLGEQVIAKKAAAVTVKQGAGRVVLIGFRPQHRNQTHGTFKLVFNALLNRLSQARDR